MYVCDIDGIPLEFRARVRMCAHMNVLENKNNISNIGIKSFDLYHLCNIYELCFDIFRWTVITSWHKFQELVNYKSFSLLFQIYREKYFNTEH